MHTDQTVRKDSDYSMLEGTTDTAQDQTMDVKMGPAPLQWEKFKYTDPEQLDERNMDAFIDAKQSLKFPIRSKGKEESKWIMDTYNSQKTPMK